MKQIASFMSEISDEFKVVVVRAISELCQKYPHKHSVMMTYLSSMLRDEVRLCVLCIGLTTLEVN